MHEGELSGASSLKDTCLIEAIEDFVENGEDSQSAHLLSEEFSVVNPEGYNQSRDVRCNICRSVFIFDGGELAFKSLWGYGNPCRRGHVIKRKWLSEHLPPRQVGND